MKFNLNLELERARNYLGALDDDVKKRVKALHKNPTQETWEDAHSIILSGRGTTNTLWQGVCAVYPEFTRSKPLDGQWPIVPSRQMLNSAIAYLTHQGVASLEGFRPWPWVMNEICERYNIPDGYFIDKELFIRDPRHRYGLYRIGADPSGCALTIGHFRYFNDAMAACEKDREILFELRAVA